VQYAPDRPCPRAHRERLGRSVPRRQARDPGTYRRRRKTLRQQSGKLAGRRLVDTMHAFDRRQMPSSAPDISPRRDREHEVADECAHRAPHRFARHARRVECQHEMGQPLVAEADSVSATVSDVPTTNGAPPWPMPGTLRNSPTGGSCWSAPDLMLPAWGLTRVRLKFSTWCSPASHSSHALSRVSAICRRNGIEAIRRVARSFPV